MPTQVDKDIWIMNGSDVVFAGASMHTRMTLIRLQDGRLWVHSPIELSDDVKEFVNCLGGDVAALIAPNKFHYMFIDSWRELFPDARVFAEENLVRKISTLAKAEVLSNDAPSLYSRDVDQVIFEGNRMFQEVVFFHKSSLSLIFTDLMINLNPQGIKLLPRLFLKFEGVTYPNGGVPRLYRWFTNDRSKAREALNVIKGWRPKRILFCHGEPFTLSADELLARQFKYLEAKD